MRIALDMGAFWQLSRPPAKAKRPTPAQRAETSLEVEQRSEPVKESLSRKPLRMSGIGTWDSSQALSADAFRARPCLRTSPRRETAPERSPAGRAAAGSNPS